MDKKNTRVIVKRILKNYLYQHKTKLLISFICMALIAGATAANAWLMQPVLDEIFIKKKSKINLYHSYYSFYYRTNKRHSLIFSINFDEFCRL